MPKNVLIDIAAAAIVGLCLYRIARMIVRGETLVRDGWWRYHWESAKGIRWMYVYGLAIHGGMIAMGAFFIWADFNGYMR
jgi:hypothetical protein